MAKDTKNNKEKKETRSFFKDFKAELKKVSWPTAKQLVTKTAAVIAVVLIISAVVFALDFVFDKGYEFITTKASNALNKNENTQSNSTVDVVDGEELVVDGVTDEDSIQVEPVVDSEIQDDSTDGEIAE